MANHLRWTQIAAAALVVVLGTAEAGAGCPQAQKIKEAFQPNIVYQARRAGVPDDKVQRDMAGIESRNLNCPELYSAYKSYLDNLGHKGGGSTFGFRKW